MTGARLFADGAHSAMGQVRKYTGEPYVNHTTRVAIMVWGRGFLEEVQSAAYLHDVVEDTGVTISCVRDRFGARVADLVAEVTDKATPADGNRAERVAINISHAAMASREGQTIKVADIIDNLRDIEKHDPAFAPVYFEEKRRFLEVLTKADWVLLGKAREMVDGYFARREGRGPG